MTTLVLFTGTLAAAVAWYLHRDTKRAHQARVRRELTRATLAYLLAERRRRRTRASLAYLGMASMSAAMGQAIKAASDLEAAMSRVSAVLSAAPTRDAFGRFARGGIIGHDLSDTRRVE